MQWARPPTYHSVMGKCKTCIITAAEAYCSRQTSTFLSRMKTSKNPP
jgi:hypothetical protein